METDERIIEEHLNSFYQFTEFTGGKIVEYDKVLTWIINTIKYISNGGDCFYMINEIIDDEGNFKENRIKRLPTQLNISIKIKKNNEEKIYTKKIKDIIDENIEKITYSTMDCIPYSPLKKPKIFKKIHNTYKGSKIQYEKKLKINMELILPFLNHIKEILADNNYNNYKYILNMLAHYVQRPHIKTNVCMVFISNEEGAGKNIFFDNFNEKLIGSNYSANIDNLDTLFARFNGILANKIVTVLDEVKTKFGGKSSDQFKSMMTQKWFNLEQKGMEHIKMNDYNNYIILTNNDIPVNIDISDRRFFVSNVSNERVGDYNYFDKLQDSFDDREAVKHLYHYLLNYDINTFRTQRDIPVTQNKIDIKYETLKTPVKFMVAVAANKVDYGIDSKKINSDTLYDAYVDFVYNNCDRSTPYRKLDFFKQIKKLISIPIINYKNKKKNKIYNINKKQVKDALVKHFKTDIEDICEIMTEDFTFTDSDTDESDDSCDSTNISYISNESNTENIIEESDSSTSIINLDEDFKKEDEIKKAPGQPGLYMCKLNNKTIYGSYDRLKKKIKDKNEKESNEFLNKIGITKEELINGCINCGKETLNGNKKCLQCKFQ